MTKSPKLDFKEFCEKEKNNQKKQPILSFDYKKFFIQNKEMISFGLRASEGLASFAKSKSVFSIAESAFRFLESTYTGTWNPSSYFNKDNGWEALNKTDLYFPDRLLFNTLSNFKEKIISFKENEASCKIHETPIGEIGVCDYKNDVVAYYRSGSSSREDIIKLLVREKEKEFKTNLISYNLESLGNDKHSATMHYLVAEKFLNIESDKSTLYVNYLRKAIDSDIKRSILFYGPPGTGKSTLAQTVLDKLGLKTFKFSFNNFDELFLSFVLTYFKFDAALIDDFDHTKCNDRTLLLIEKLRNSVKVVFATANSLEEFHPSVIRPARFDQIIKIDEIESHSIKDILGKLSEQFADRVKKWPVAYINELVLRSKLYPIEFIEDHFKELNIRVINQIKVLEKSKDKDDSDDGD